MDRLLCGDVGFGKTEVAFVAAFKAILDSKQVLFLCPTTILSNPFALVIFLVAMMFYLMSSPAKEKTKLMEDFMKMYIAEYSGHFE